MIALKDRFKREFEQREDLNSSFLPFFSLFLLFLFSNVKSSSSAKHVVHPSLGVVHRALWQETHQINPHGESGTPLKAHTKASLDLKKVVSSPPSTKRGVNSWEEVHQDPSSRFSSFFYDHSQESYAKRSLEQTEEDKKIQQVTHTFSSFSHFPLLLGNVGNGFRSRKSYRRDWKKSHLFC